ncbi:hypothetical protein J4423_01335 [Candidatus Pacearchaeota archaeon]|nr:hypothetical protein [Candidatus Pacearchaeota archaeon]
MVVETLEQAVEVFPEIKDFVDYVVQTGGRNTLNVNNNTLNWRHEKDFYGKIPSSFYHMALSLDRIDPKMTLFFREMQVGCQPFHEPARGDELLKKLPEIFEAMKRVYDKCFVKDRYIFTETISRDSQGSVSLGVELNLD